MGEQTRGMFGVDGTGDTSGFGGLVRRRTSVLDAPRPYGGYYDEVVDALDEELAYSGELRRTRSRRSSSTAAS